MTASIDFTFAQNLNSRLSELGLSQYRLAKLSGLSTSYIGNLIQGRRLPSSTSIEKLAPVLGLTSDDLVAWSDLARLGEKRLSQVSSLKFSGSSREVSLLDELLEIANDLLAMGASELTEILRRLTELLAMHGVIVWLVDRAELSLSIAGSYGMSQAYLDYGRNCNLVFDYRKIKPPIVTCFEKNSILIVDTHEVETNEVFLSVCQAEGFNALYLFPINFENRTLGVTVCYLKDGHCLMGHRVERAVQLVSNIFGAYATSLSGILIG